MLKMTLLTGVLAAAGAHASAAKFDAPDLNLELEMHRRVTNTSATVDAGPGVLAPDAYVENYRVGAGDTLWSLSTLLYGDGAYWPRVWAQNHGIGNPHLVKPGHVLEFLLGSEDDAPAFRFTEEGAESGVELASAAGSSLVEIPPPEVAPRPILRVPPSFPEWQSVYRRQPKPILDDRNLGKRRVEAQSRMYLNAWVEEKPIAPIGSILENDTEAGLPVVNQYVFVKLKKGAARAGAKMLVIQNPAPLRRTTDTFEDDRAAYLVQVTAEIEVTEQVPAKFDRSNDRETFETWRALVVKTTGLSNKDLSIIPGQLTFVDISPEGPHGEATAQIIGSERHTTSLLYGGGDTVFLDRGTAAGIAVGQIYDIYSDRRSRHRKTPVVYSPAPVGRLKVVRVSGNLATAFILQAHDSIMQGDRARAIGSRDDLTGARDVSSLGAAVPGDEEQAIEDSGGDLSGLDAVDDESVSEDDSGLDAELDAETI